MSQDSLFGDSSPTKPKAAKPGKTKNGFVSSIWSFPPTEDVSYAGHSIYRWYGTLPGPLVARLLDLYGSGLAHPVWDPMAGGGTTLVEARLKGVPAVGYDINALSCLVARTKLDPFPTAIQEVIDALHGIRAGSSRSRDISGFEDASFGYARKWFNEPSLERLLQVASAIGEAKFETRLQRLLLVALAGITREVAEVDPRCTHHLVRKGKGYVDALPLLGKRALAIAEAVAEVPLREAAPGADWLIHQQSALEPAADTQADLVIAHPPYLGVIHYHLIHRLGTEVLRYLQAEHGLSALDGLTFDAEEIKAGDGSTDNSAKYGVFLEGLASSLSEVVVPGGRAVIILGDARHKGMLRHPFTDAIRLMEESGFALEENFIWLLQNNGGMHVLRRGHHIDHNYIMVFKKL